MPGPPDSLLRPDAQFGLLVDPMASRTTETMRNLALTGHAGAGKTTLTEAMLARVGAITRQGTVEDGTTVSDFEPEEKHHGHSVNAAFVHFEHEGTEITVADTPGFPDMIGQALSVLPSVECVAIVISADKGIQSMTRRMMQIVQDRNLPHLIIVNKVDEHLSDLEPLLDSIRETFGSECIPINLPNPDGTGVIDAWEKSEGQVAFSSVSDLHQQLVDQCVESDEELMEAYLAQGHLTKEQLHNAFEAALRQAHLVPVLFCSARTGVGLDALLHTIANLGPNPLEGNPRPFLHREGDDGPDEPWFPKPDPELSPVAHVFKVTTDQFVGKLSMLKVHQGTFTSNSSLYMDGVKKPIKLAHILRVNGKKHDEIDRALPGDIVAIAKVEELEFDGVLHGQDIDHLRLKPLNMPRPMYGQAVEPANRGDERKFSTALHKLLQEDPTVELERVGTTGELVLRAMGELHMRVLLEKLQNRFNVEVTTHPPKIAYRETIRGRAEGHHRHKKQTGGAGQFGEVFLRIEPLDETEANGTELEFVDDTVGGSIPRQFMPAVEKGVRRAMAEGAIAGFPIHGVRVRVYDGKHHAVDSKEVAFVAAGRKAFVEAVKKANPAILEPIVNIEVTAPGGAVGDVNGLIATKRGQVQTSDYLPGDQVVVHAQAPLGEISEFSSELKSITHGQGSFAVDYSHYAPAPAHVQSELVAAYQPTAEED